MYKLHYRQYAAPMQIGVTIRAAESTEGQFVPVQHEYATLPCISFLTCSSRVMVKGYQKDRFDVM